MNTQAKTLTFHYRIYQYQNGLGEDVFQIKIRGWLGIYSWCIWPDDPVVVRYQASFREEAMEFIRKDAERRRKEWAESNRNRLKAELKLVITEDIQA